jgi:hypothetical protein
MPRYWLRREAVPRSRLAPAAFAIEKLTAVADDLDAITRPERINRLGPSCPSAAVEEHLDERHVPFRID